MADVLTVYEKLIAAHPDVERKGKTTPYTSIHGNMFSFITKEGRLALRLPEDAQEAIVAKGGALCFQYGKRMRGYVEIPASMLSNARAMKKHFAACVEHAKTLKPKPTTKPKGKKAAKKKAAKKKAAKKKAAKKKAAKKKAAKKKAAKKKAAKKKAARRDR